MTLKYIKQFKELSNDKVALVGGKNASLGEMFNQLSSKGVKIPDGFATTAEAYWLFLDENNIREKLSQLMTKIDLKDFSNLREIGSEARALVLNAVIPEQIATEIKSAYKNLYAGQNTEIEVAVRSSATAEDLPTASFAGQHDSFLNIKGEEVLIHTLQKCFASLFNDRAIKYRINNGFKHMNVALSVGVQRMVRSDLASAGVGFTIEPETGFENMIYLTGSWGLGENVVQGAVNPDEFYLFKPSIRDHKKSLVTKILGSKTKTMVYATGQNSLNQSIENIDTPLERQLLFVLSDSEIETLAQWCLIIEEHYKMPMDIEWAKDGITNELFIVQARPETIHNKLKDAFFKEYRLTEKGDLITTGKAVGSKIVSGIARVLESPAEANKLQTGEILVTDITNPDWNIVLKKASVIITNKGGRTSHAAIVARELGVAAVVGTTNATQKIKDGQLITVSCAEGDEGKVFDGKLTWEEHEIDFENTKLPKTQPMFILADPDKALQLSFYPNQGVGLMRMEFVINNSIQIHPMALVKFDELKDEKARQEIERLTINHPDKKEYFIDKLSQAIAFVAAAFYPKDVIVRMSDFKTNEYANLIGGKQFEPHEENPMLGFRGASRYYSDLYREGFRLECEAIKTVRNKMGLTNLKAMIPFCRTVAEGEKVVKLMEEFGLKQGTNGLEIYVMIEIPSNVILAEKFAKVFDGFSIGSNDLTQLTLGIDRDSAIISNLFDENNEAVKWMLQNVIQTAKKCGVKIGLCGQAPSDYPEFAQFLVEQGINSISFNPDALIKGIENINKAEDKS
ncbi:MAG: phosphoenolpyruvate synthase, partial [Daejeonella sp.]